MKNNWEMKTLGELCLELFAGGDVPKHSHSKVLCEEFQIPIFSNGEKDKGLYGYTNVARVRKPCLTISARGTIGYTEIRNEPFYPAVRLIVAIPNESIIDLDYFKYVISSFDFVHSGSSIPQLTIPMIRDHKINLPPLTEQKRIVKILDKKFGAIEELKKVTQQQIVDAKELFESRLNEVFEKPSSEYASLQLTELIKIKHGFAFKSQWFCKSGEFVLLTPGNFYEEGGYRDRGDKQKFYCGTIPQEYVLAKNDLLVAMTEQAKGLLGSPILVPRSNKFLHNQRLGLVQFISDSLHYKYLYHYFNTRKLRESLFNSGTGVKVRHTSPEKITRNFINLLSLKEQKQIAKELDELSEKTRGLQAIFRRKIADLEELKKSYLEQAFSGKL